MARHIAIACITLGVLLAAAAMALADPIVDFQKTQTAEKIQRNAELRQSPILDPKHPSLPASDLFSLHIEHAQLVLRTPLPNSPSGQQHRVKIGDQDGWAFLTVEGTAEKKGPPALPAFFNLIRVTFETNKTQTLSIQQSAGTFFNLSLQDRTPTGSRVIQLQEQFPNPMARFPGGCQLVVMEMTSGKPWRPLMWRSTDFTAFSVEHPAEMERYLRPLFRQIDGEGALTPDQMLAFELFSAQWSVASDTTAKVRSLVDKLTGGDFRSRTRAQNELANLGRDAALVLIHLDRAHLAPEQNDRVDLLLTPYCPVPEHEAAKLRTNPGFLANCLYSEDLIIRKAAFAQLLAVTKRPLHFDPAADGTTRSAQISAILDQVAASKTAVPQK